MPLYEDGKFCPIFIGDMHPVKLMDGNNVIEPTEVEVSGETLNVGKTYNDTAYLTINGKTIETGTGTKAPDNPYVFSSAGQGDNFDVVSRTPNLVTNGNFADTTGYFGSGFTVSASNNILTALGNVTAVAGSFYTDLSLPVVTGKKIFFRAKVKAKSSFTSIDAVLRGSTSGTTGTVTFQAITTPTIDNEHTLHGVATVGATITGNIRLTVRAFDTGGNILNKSFEVQEMFAVDMGNTVESSSIYNLTAAQMSTLFPNWVAKKDSTTNFPYTLRSLPDGTKDYDVTDAVAKTRKLYMNIGEATIIGGGAMFVYNTFADVVRFSMYLSTYAGNGVANGDIVCSHLPNAKDAFTSNSENIFIHSSSAANFYVSFTKSRLGIIDTDTDAIKITKCKEWLALNPVKAQYKLAVPVVTDLNYEEVKTYYPQTQIYTNADVQPTLEGKFRVIGT